MTTEAPAGQALHNLTTWPTVANSARERWGTVLFSSSYIQPDGGRNQAEGTTFQKILSERGKKKTFPPSELLKLEQIKSGTKLPNYTKRRKKIMCNRWLLQRQLLDTPPPLPPARGGNSLLVQLVRATWLVQWGQQEVGGATLLYWS